MSFNLFKTSRIRGAWVMLPLFFITIFMVSCEKADHDELCPEETSFQSRACETNDSTDTTNLNVNIGTEGWGETVNVNF